MGSEMCIRDSQWTAALANVTYLPGQLRRGRLPTARRSGKWDSQTPPLDQMPYHARGGGLVVLAGSRSTNGRKGGVGTRAHWRTGSDDLIIKGTRHRAMGFYTHRLRPLPSKGNKPGSSGQKQLQGGPGVCGENPG